MGGVDPELADLVTALQQRYGERLDAVLLYGSWRRGRRDTMPDFYVLLDDYPPGWRYWLGRLLPPTVLVQKAEPLRAKVTVLTTTQLERAVDRDFHPYFRARFAQPMPLQMTRSPALLARVERLVQVAQTRLMQSVADCWPPAGLPGAAAFWQETFRLTYGAELRSESAERIAELYLTDRPHYDALYQTLLQTHQPSARRHRWAGLSWRGRQLTGKLFSALRIIKSALTFDDPLDYLAWKVGRQSGVQLAPSERARRWPLLFGWWFVWQLYRRGGFR